MQPMMLLVMVSYPRDRMCVSMYIYNIYHLVCFIILVLIPFPLQVPLVQQSLHVQSSAKVANQLLLV